MKLSILGPPGAGKSTQARRISAMCSLKHIYAGELLRREMETESPFAERIRYDLERGFLVPADIIVCLVEAALARSNGNYVLDGFPRTLDQAIEMEYLLLERRERLDAVIYLFLNKKEVFHRLLARGRPDDTPEIIKERLCVFHKETDAVLEFYEEKGLLITVSGEDEVDLVTGRIIGALESRLTHIHDSSQ